MADAMNGSRSRGGWWIVVVAIVGVALVLTELWINVREETQSRQAEPVQSERTLNDGPQPEPTPTADLDRPYWEE